MPQKKSEGKKKEIRYGKEAFMKSKRFFHERDLIHAVLASDRQYTIEEAEKKIKEFRERRVQ